MKKIVKYILAFILLGVFVLALQFFVVPKISVMPWFLKHNLDNNKQKTVVVNKTEKIIVKENFSLQKVAENTLPSMVNIVFEPIGRSRQQIVLPISQNGLILSSDGIVVTVLPQNQKLLSEKMYKIKIALNNREMIEAKILDRDDFNGLLFLKVDKDNLPVASFGEGASLENGEKVVLVGHSLENHQPLLSLNSVQNYQRDFNDSGARFVFSDRNSEVFVLNNAIADIFKGSAIIDYDGKVGGIVARKIDNSGKVKTFVIPARNVQKSFRQLIANGKIAYPKLGIYYLNITPVLAEMNKLKYSNGALVYTPSGRVVTIKGSRGRKVGLHFGDIILKVNGEEITAENTLNTILSKYKNSDKLVLEVWRKKDGEVEQIKL